MAEQREQILSNQVCVLFDEWRLKGRFHGVAFHVGNEVAVPKMHPGQAKKFWDKRKAMGFVDGAPDWVVAWRGGMLFIELKAPRIFGVSEKTGKIKQTKAAGTLSDAQIAFRADCEAFGVAYTVCYDIGQVERDLIMYGGLKA